MKGMSISKLCTPAMLYFVLSVIAIIMAIFTNFQPMSILVKILWVLFYTWFLNFLCDKGYTAISWFLVLLPFFMLAVVAVLALEVTIRAKR